MRYIQGYTLGAQSVNPAIVVKTAYVTNDFSNAAFNDPVGGKEFAQTFITTNKVDVLFQVAGKTGNGVLDAACDANIYGVGVDVDQAISLPERRQVHRDQRGEAPPARDRDGHPGASRQARSWPATSSSTRRPRASAPRRARPRRLDHPGHPDQGRRGHGGDDRRLRS